MPTEKTKGRDFFPLQQGEPVLLFHQPVQKEAEEKQKEPGDQGKVIGRGKTGGGETEIAGQIVAIPGFGQRKKLSAKEAEPAPVDGPGKDEKNGAPTKAKPSRDPHKQGREETDQQSG